MECPLRQEFKCILQIVYIILSIHCLLLRICKVVESGILGPTGMVISPTRKISDVRYTGSRLSHLLDVKYVLVRGYIKTSNSGSTNVRFYEYYNIDVKLGVQVQAKLDNDDL